MGIFRFKTKTALSCLFSLIVFFSFILASQNFVYASAIQNGQQLQSQFEGEFKNILVDVRGSRGGNGDVAAGYLTTMAFLEEYGLKSQITMLVDFESKKILDRLAKGNSMFWNSVKTAEINSLPQEISFDLYLSLASPSGTFRYGSEVQVRPPTTLVDEKSAPTQQKINVTHDAVLLVQTVLGNTENPQSLNPYAVVRANGINFDMSPAGLGENEAGIYHDYVASFLRGKSTQYVQKFTSSQLPLIGEAATENNLLNILNGHKLRGSRIGLAYGISASSTHKQFNGYLAGLATDTQGSYCLVTPSRFDINSVKDPLLQARILVLDSTQQQLPEKAEEGKIYILKTPTLPHPIFVGLMAYSMKQGITPVGAGDGFLSAAITLGLPFVMTQVSWNAKNIGNLKLKLMQLASANLPILKLQIFERIFSGNNLFESQRLQVFTQEFSELMGKIPSLTERLMNAAVAVKAATKPDANMVSISEGILDPTLKASVAKGGTKGEMRKTNKGFDYVNAFKMHIHDFFHKKYTPLEKIIDIDDTFYFKKEIFKTHDLSFQQSGHQKIDNLKDDSFTQKKYINSFLQDFEAIKAKIAQLKGTSAGDSKQTTATPQKMDFEAFWNAHEGTQNTNPKNDLGAPAHKSECWDYIKKIKKLDHPQF